MIISLLLRPLIISICVFCTPLYAHHSAFLFETSEPIVVEGFISEVIFAHPHSSIFIDVEGEDGSLVRWAIENSGSLFATRRRGFDENSLLPGDPITACGYAPKRVYSTAEELEERGAVVPEWWGTADKFITGRLLILKDGPAEHWSHYGSLEVCQSMLGSL